VVTALVIALPRAALAHGIGGRGDLPVPLEFFLVGAAVVLLLSFGALAVLWPSPRLQAGPRFRSTGWAVPRWVAGAAAAFGLVMGGGVSVASLACNPGIFIVLGVAVLQGYTLWGMAIMAAYAVGFSLPLAVIMLGVSFGKSAIKAKRTESAMRIIGGVLLIIAGFYFLTSV